MTPLSIAARSSPDATGALTAEPPLPSGADGGWQAASISRDARASRFIRA
jgi:hypothetical protein